MQTNNYDIMILGAGASGLCAGAIAAANGVKVALLDHADKTGKKILIAGGGKCNLTNKYISPLDYAGKNPEFVRSALAALSPAALLETLQKHKIELEEREHGQIFCKHSSRDMLDFLLNNCKKNGCTFLLGQRIVSVKKTDGNRGFTVVTEQSRYIAKKLVLALGSCAYPQIGASNLGYHLARGFGHEVIEVSPALVGLEMPKKWWGENLAGIAVPVNLYLNRTDKKSSKPFCVAENLNLLFTHGGISGPAVLQASLFWEKGQTIECQFIEWEKFETCFHHLPNTKLLLKNLLKTFLPLRLVENILPPELPNKKVAEISKAERLALRKICCTNPLIPVNTEGFKKAEAAKGGVDTKDISSKTMESKLVEGLYFCGEILDITGRLGGYNLHWAFASGLVAGEQAAIQCKQS